MEGEQTVSIYCSVVCVDLAAKWLHLQVHLERFISSYDSVSFTDYTGITVPKKYMKHIAGIIKAATGLNVLYVTDRSVYTVDTRHFILSALPEMCPCGRPRKKSPGNIQLSR
jgi:hypothetical protein